MNIIKHLFEFPEILAQCQSYNLTNPLALYLYELANLANTFYEKIPVLKATDEAELAARLLLVQTAARVLQIGLGLLGIGTLEQI